MDIEGGTTPLGLTKRREFITLLGGARPLRQRFGAQVPQGDGRSLRRAALLGSWLGFCAARSLATSLAGLVNHWSAYKLWTHRGTPPEAQSFCSWFKLL